MAKHTVTSIQAQYQLMLAKLKPVEDGAFGMFPIGEFVAPPGYRLHSATHLNTSAIVGGPTRVLMVFEQVSQFQQEVDVPDGAVIANGTDTPN